APEDARAIIDQLPPFIFSVGVFVNESRERILEVARIAGIGIVQLHGDESPEFCRELDSLKIIKALRVGEGFNPDSIARFDVSAVLLDTNIKGSYGGTGRRFDWRVAIEAKQYARIILAGGLNADNVAEAIAEVKPFGIDVCSGVEAEPGRKDLDKLRRFMTEVKRAISQIDFEV
ncbi:MAG: phosphoribosylanthranilate isomerase, partial [Acidobacteriota bacterium]